MLLRMAAAIVVLLNLSQVAALAQGRPSAVQTDTVEMREMTETITVFGQLVAVRESEVATRVAGVVREIPVQVGSVLKAGERLAQMDTARLEIELASAEAQLAIAQAGLLVAEAQTDRALKSFERAQELTANNSISGAQFDERASTFAEAQGGLAQARARIAAAENAVALAEYNLANATVRAPFDGVVLDVVAQPGQFAGAGSLIATLLDTATMEVEANVPARYTHTLSPGRSVMGVTDAGAGFEMALRSVLPTEFSETRTRPVRFSLATVDPSFAIGQTVTLEVPIAETRDVLVVSKDALVQARDGWTAFVNDDGAAAPRTVQIGAAIGETFEVLSGLALGDEVVVRGNERLRPGQQIAPMRGSAPGAAGDGARAGASGESAEEG